MDLPEAKANLSKFKKRYKVSVVEISCLEATGLEKLKQTLLKQVIKLRGADKIRLMK
jgi:GTP-binding protein